MTITQKEIKQAAGQNRIVIGTRSVIKEAKGGKLDSVVCASNCSDNTLRDLDYYSKISALKINKFDGDSLKLGEVCGKQFAVSLVGIRK